MSEPIRTDLLALTADSLAALTNRGLVKRASRERDEGKGPTIVVDDAGTIEARADDGTVTVLPAGMPLDQATCSCGAAGSCRHRLALVLGYQARAATAPAATAPAATTVAWSPGRFTDEELLARLGTRRLESARKAHRTGYRARLHRPGRADPVASVELPSCTVRFLVPDDLSYARTDAADQTRDEMVALAVWAFREADERGLDGADVELDIGTVARGEAGLEPLLDELGRLLAVGVIHVDAHYDQVLLAHRNELERGNLRWPLAALDDLLEQLTAHRSRSSAHDPGRLADLVVELHARHRAAGRGAGTLRTSVLGTDEAAEVRLRRTRLLGIGARVHGNGEERSVEIFLAQADTGTVLVLRRHWTAGTGEWLTGADLAPRRLGPSMTVGRLAAGNVVTESAVRQASRAVRFSTSRVGQTTVTASTGDWSDLPRVALVDDHAAPRYVRPRIEAEQVRIIEVAEAVVAGYRPGDQQLDVLLTDRTGAQIWIAARHRAVAPGALDAIVSAVDGSDGPLRFVSGAVARSHGRLVVDPAALVVGDRVVVPDLNPARGDHTPGAAPPEQDDPLAAALLGAWSVLADVLHRGADHLPPTFRDRAEQAAGELDRVGLTGAAAALRRAAPDFAPAAWVEAGLRIAITAERHAGGAGA